MQSKTKLEALSGAHAGRRIVVVSGNFNVIHPGHLRVLRFARSCGDLLVVLLFSDDAPGVVVNGHDRALSLAALEFVDEVVTIAPDALLSSIQVLKPYAVVKGKEHEADDNPEREVLSGCGGHLIFSAGEQNFSSKDLIRHELAHPTYSRLLKAHDFLRKHHLSVDSLIQRVGSFEGARVLVLGELILDEYIYCDPLGLSQEDPTIVVTPIETKRFIGAAGIVAAHLAGLGADVTYCSIVGADSMAGEAEREIKALGVSPLFIHDETRPTILKQRFRAHGKTLLRVSHLRSHDVSQEYWQRAVSDMREVLPGMDAVVFSDFNYGCLPQPFVDEVIRACHRHSVPFFADSQASSQVGDVSRYLGADLLAATEREARVAMRDFKSGLQNVANALMAKSQAENLLIKLGAEGVLSITGYPNPITDSLPALNKSPVDVAGAGDAMLATATLCRVRGASVFEAAYLGSVASGIQVSRIGNLPLTGQELVAGLSA